MGPATRHLRRVTARLRWQQRALRRLLAWPAAGGHTLTRRRLFNFYLARAEYLRGRTTLRSYPTRLVVEPVSACNLRCPYCATGAERSARPRALMSLDLYRRVLDELGDYLLEVEAFHWGEPLLHPQIDAMIHAASARGIATTINTNFSLPFDAAGAQRLVASGLGELTVSVDGASQATYEQYRVRGDLARVLANCQLIADAKRALGSPTPRCNLEFHVFPHNLADVPQMTELARGLDMNLRVFKGVVPGAEWGTNTEFQFCVDPIPVPCIFLWGTALLSTDGGCSPCRGTFDPADDMGRLGDEPLGSARFRTVWNSPRYQSARRFYRARTGSARERQQVCFDCPNTVMWERWQAHTAAGGQAESFDIGYGTNEIWNYFWNRRPRAATAGE